MSKIWWISSFSSILMDSESSCWWWSQWMSVIFEGICVCNFDPQKSVVIFCTKVESKVSSLWKCDPLLYPDSINYLFLVFCVVDVPTNLCMLIISSQSTILVLKDLVFRVRLYSLISPISMVWSPLFFQEFVSSVRSDINSVIGYSLPIRF